MNYFIVIVKKQKNEGNMQMENKRDGKTVKRLQKYMELLGEAKCPKQIG